MGDATVKAREVITYPQGTLTVVSGAGEEEGAMSVAFFDRNQNGKLDEGDQKILVGSLACPKTAKKVDDASAKSFCIAPISKADVSRYGDVVGGIFKKAWEERLSLPKNVKPQSQGVCAIDIPAGPDTLASTRFFEARFQAPFTLRTNTLPESKRYTAKDLERILQQAGEETPVVDPARCTEADASLEIPIEGGKSRGKLAISGRSSISASFYAGLPLALGLRANPLLPHLGTEGGLGTMHLNLRP